MTEIEILKADLHDVTTRILSQADVIREQSARIAELAEENRKLKKDVDDLEFRLHNYESQHE